MRRLVVRVKGTFRRFERSEIPIRAAALAYHTLLSIVPIVGLVFWYLQQIHVTERWLNGLKDFVSAQLNVVSSAAFLSYFNKFILSVQGKGASWGWIGLGVLLYTAWNLVEKFGGSVDTILATATIRPDEKVSSVRLIGRRILAMLLLPVALTVSLALTDWIVRDSWLHAIFRLKAVGPVIALPLAWVTTILSIFLVYYLIPKNRVPWKEAMRAALVVGPASELVRFVFGIYAKHAVSTYKIYGVLAVIPLFILWVQIGWMILLSGTLLIRFTRPVPGQSPGE